MLRKIFSDRFLFCTVFFIALPACISYQVQDPFITPRVILVSAAIIAFMAWSFLKPSTAIQQVYLIPTVALLVFFLLSAAGIMKSLNPGDAWYEWLKSFLIFPVMLITAVLFRGDDSRKMLLKFSQVCILGLSAYYFYQWLNYLKHPELELVFDLKLHIASTLGNKNFYAEVALLLLPLAVAGYFLLERFWKWLCLANAIVLFVSVILTQSFAALCGMVVSGLAVIFVFNSGRFKWRMKGSRQIIVASVVISAVLFAVYRSGVVSNIAQRFTTFQQYIQHPELMDATAKANSNSTFERMLLWRNSLGLIQEHPLTGCGVGNWKLMYPKFGIGGTRYIESGYVHYEHPHNDFLLIAAESGIPSLLAYLIFFISVLWILIRRIRSGNSGHLWDAGVAFAILSFLIVSIFSFPRIRFYGWMLIGMYVGLLYASDIVSGIRVKKITTGFWKTQLLICAVLAGWALAAGIQHFSGEVHSKNLQIAKKQRNMARVVREAEKASSWYSPVDETATPFTWYMGMAMFYSGDVTGAKAKFEDALQKNPYHIQLLNDLATTYEQTKEPERAIALYKQALDITPYFPQSLLNISAAYFNIGRKDSAFVFIDKLYGIKLDDQGKKSYNAYLPAILREKVYLGLDLVPEALREKAVQEAADSSIVKPAYRRSKTNHTDFIAEFSAAIRDIPMP